MKEYYKNNKDKAKEYSLKNKEKIREKNKNYVERNKEEVKRKKKAYREANKEQIRIQTKEYRDKNKEAVSLRTKSYRERNKDKVRRTTRVYYDKNIDVIKNRNKEYCKNNKDKAKIYSQNRRSRLNGNNGKFTKKDIDFIIKFQSNLCFYCDKDISDNYHIDHFVPISKGGSNNPENLVISCPQCNLFKNAKEPLDFLEQINKLHLLDVLKERILQQNSLDIMNKLRMV